MELVCISIVVAVAVVMSVTPYSLEAVAALMALGEPKIALLAGLAI